MLDDQGIGIIHVPAGFGPHSASNPVESRSDRGEKLTTYLRVVKKFLYTSVNKLVQKFTQKIVRIYHKTRKSNDLYVHLCALQHIMKRLM
jgi:hypothetical protein